MKQICNFVLNLHGSLVYLMSVFNETLLCSINLCQLNVMIQEWGFFSAELSCCKIFFFFMTTF